METTCVVDKKNLGVTKCTKIIGLPRYMIETPVDFKFTPEDMADLTTFRTALEALLYGPVGQRGYLWPFFHAFENVSEAAVRQETALADLHVRDGKYRFRFHIAADLCLHRAMFSHRATQGRYFIGDIEGDMYGTTDEDGNFYGFNISLLNTEKLNISDGSVATTSPIYVVLSDNKELDRDGGSLAVGQVINTTARLTDVTLTVVGTPSATSLVVSVAVTCDGTPVNGLVLADFVKTGTGTLDSVTEVDGTYTFVATGMGDGTIDLDVPEDLSVKGYESVGAATINVP